MPEASARLIVLAGLTGLLYPLCFPEFDLGLLAWIVLVPLQLALEGAVPRRAFWTGWLAGAIAFTGTMFWVVTAMHVYGKLPLVLSYVALGLLAAYLGLYLAVYALALTWLRDRLPVLIILGAPCAWVTLEWIRTYLFTGLPWALLGYSQYQWLPVIQIADHTGVYGVSFLVVLVNTALGDAACWALRRYGRGPRGKPATAFPWTSAVAAMLGMVITLVYGHIVLSLAPVPDQSRSLRIAVVQPNIDQARKWDAAFRRETLDRYARLTARSAAGADLIIWPEAATPFLFEQEQQYRDEISALVRAHDIPLLFGSPALRYFPDGRPYLLNSAYLLDRGGTILGRYDKRHLVPFGEYVPLRPVLFFLEKLVVGIGDFEPGPEPTILGVPDSTGNRSSGRAARFGVAICYEVIFPDLVRAFAERGADFMVTITNDAWFGYSGAPFQHFGMVVLRAVENRVAFARAANTGVSGFIDPQGRILLATPIFAERAETGTIPIERVPTFYTAHGDVFADACVIITGLLFFAAWRRTRPGAKA